MIWPDDYVNTVICGDCFEVMRSMPEHSADIVVTDPPFNLDLHASSGRCSGAFAGRGTSVFTKIRTSFGSPFSPRDLLAECYRLCRPFVGYFWCSRRQLEEYLAASRELGLFSDVLVWCKKNPPPLNCNSLLSDLEYCVQVRESGAPHIKGLAYGVYSKWYCSSRVNSSSVMNRIKHPTVKPLDLISRHIAVSSEPGAIVLDPFLGSGTTAVAARNLGRRFIGIEQNPEYCEIAAQRLQQQPMDFNAGEKRYA